MGKFSFAGRTVVAPGILVTSQIGAARVLSLLPFGTIAMVGPSDGGSGGGAVYRFDSITTAQRLLRSGPLYDALKNAANVGGAAGFVAVVVGSKMPASLTLAGAGGSSATVTSGDQGEYTNAITVAVSAGTATGSVAVTISYPDALSGATVYVGGPGSAYDGITSFSQLARIVAADNVLTPSASTGFPPVVVVSVVQDGAPTAAARANLSGGTGGGKQQIAFADVKVGIDSLIDQDFDLGHLVGVYDAPAQAYADAQAQQVRPLGKLRRWLHQVVPTGVTIGNNAGDKKVQNSAAVASAIQGRATLINSERSTVSGQRVLISDPATALTTYVDMAPLLCGMAAYYGAVGPNGPSTPLTGKAVPGALGVDYPVLATTGDVDATILAGGIVVEQRGAGNAATVTVVQSVTTAPNDPSGNPWIYGEFSVVRGSDAVLANMIAAVETGSSIGSGNTPGVMQALIADARDILEDAKEAGWIVDFDPASIVIQQIGTLGEDDLLSYSMLPTLPLNHVAINQTLLPYQAAVSIGGSVNG